MLIHISFFIASLFIRRSFFTDGHYVGEDTSRYLAGSTSTSTSTIERDGKIFNNEHILFDVIQLNELTELIHLDECLFGKKLQTSIHF